MPRPTQFIADNFSSPNQSLGEVPDLAGQAKARAFETLARGFSQLGAGLDEYNKRKDAINQRINLDQAQIEAMRAAQDSFNFANTNPEGAADGSSLVSDYELSFEERKLDYLDGIEDDTLKQQAANAFDNEMLKQRDTLYNAQRQKHATFATQESDKAKRAYNAVVFNDPSKFGEAVGTLENHYTAMVEAKLITPDQKESLKQNAIKESAMTAINGMTLIRQDYYQAIERLVTGDMALIFSDEDKKKLITDIQNNKMRSSDTELKSIAQMEARSKKELEEQRTQTFSRIFNNATKASSPAAREAVQKQLNMARGMDLISNVDFSFAQSVMNEDVTKNDDKVAFDLAYNITGGADTNAMREKVKELTVREEMKASTARGLLTKISEIENQQKTQGKTIYDDKLKNGRDLLDGVFGSKDFLDKLGNRGQQKAIRRNQAESRYIDVLTGNPGIDPREAAKQVVEELNGLDPSTVPFVRGVPFELQTNQNQIKRAAQQVDRQYQAGKITKERRNQIILDLRERVRTLNSLDQMRQSQTAKPKEK